MWPRRAHKGYPSRCSITSQVLPHVKCSAALSQSSKIFSLEIASLATLKCRNVCTFRSNPLHLSSKYLQLQTQWATALLFCALHLCSGKPVLGLYLMQAVVRLIVVKRSCSQVKRFLLCS